MDGTVIVSGGAGQFNIAGHALCWVHAERLIHKLDTFCEAHVRAEELIRHRIWWLDEYLKAYRQAPTSRRASELRRRFSRIPGPAASAGTRSDQGRDCCDAFLALMKTCAKQAVQFWHYLGNRLQVPEAPAIPRLAELIRQSAPALMARRFAPVTSVHIVIYHRCWREGLTGMPELRDHNSRPGGLAGLADAEGWTHAAMGSHRGLLEARVKHSERWQVRADFGQRGPHQERAWPQDGCE